MPSSLPYVTIDPFQPFRLDDRVAIVTGASAGLGARFARVLAAAGARVVLAARRAERLESLAAELARCARGAVRPCGRGCAGRARGRNAIERYGRVDILVNNAGVSEPTPALDESTEHFANTLRVNLVAPFELARESARTMIDSGNGGVVINVASIWGLFGVGQIPEAGYAASKGGMVNMTRELAAQWAPARRAGELPCAGLVPHRDDRRTVVRRRSRGALDAAQHADGPGRRRARTRRRPPLPGRRREHAS